MRRRYWNSFARQAVKRVALPGDIQDEIFCTGLVNSAVAQLGGLDILVNNAARQTAQESILDITTEQLDATYKTNVYAMFWITKTALKYMTAGAADHHNTTSVNAYDPSPNMLDYATTKAAIAIFTKGLAKTAGRQRYPGECRGPGPDLDASAGVRRTAAFEAWRNSAPRHHWGRPGQPAELAALYVLLATNEATYTTGQVYGAVGGRGGP